MILVLGGTTEGRIAVRALENGEGHYWYSTCSDLQRVECVHGEHITGKMTVEDMVGFCRTNGVRLIVDAAHPFAARLHETVARVSGICALPVVRFERRYPVAEGENVVMCSDFADAMERMERHGVRRLLALTGVQTIGALCRWWSGHETFFRILKREDSLVQAEAAGFARDHLVYYDEDGENTPLLVGRLHPDALLTKESGESGGFISKLDVARQAGIPLFVVRRPEMPRGFIQVDGPYGLRREVERLVPGFYPLRTGFTTGSCATAAAKAALLALTRGEMAEEVTFRIPEGETMRMGIESVSVLPEGAVASVIKDAGDDPDVTDGCCISVTVSLSDEPGIRFHAGHGVGVATLPGLGLEVGDPAINPVPRAMMTQTLREIYEGGLEVTVSVEDGERLAKSTFNPRVGITGGVSIIGTSGIVRPLSHEAFVESMLRETRVALASGCGRVVVNSGAKSERFMRALYPELPPHAFVHYGNAVGEMMRVAREAGVENLTIGLMLGKAVKLAEGHMDTHSHKVTLNRQFLMDLARRLGCSSEGVRRIGIMNFSRELPELLEGEDGRRMFDALTELCHRHCKEVFHGSLETVLMADDGRILSRCLEI